MTDFTSILKVLEDGQHHSLDELAGHVNNDVKTVGAMLDRLRGDGMRIDVSGTGVCWQGAVPILSVRRIQEALDLPVQQALASLEVFYALDSTSSHLARQPASHQMRACLAEMQTSGRGRRGNLWVSPPCSNIYLSLRWKFGSDPAQLAGLSLAVGIAVARQLAQWSRSHVGLKWPNDLYIEGRKLGGILVELISTSSHHADAIIGIGLNIRMQDPGLRIDHPWTSLHRYENAVDPIDRNLLVAALLNAVIALLVDFPSQGAAFIQSQWSDYDVALGRPVKIQSGTEVIQGTGAGIDDAYRFLLRIGDNTRSFHSGEVSLKIR